MSRIGVIGAGAWGTALAMVAQRAGNEVVIQAHERSVVDSINNIHENTEFLKGFKLDSTIKATTDFAKVLDSDVILLVTPAQFLRPVCCLDISLYKPNFKKNLELIQIKWRIFWIISFCSFFQDIF